MPKAQQARLVRCLRPARPWRRRGPRPCARQPPPSLTPSPKRKAQEKRSTFMPISARPDVLEFFDRYQRGADTSDPEVVRDCFAETFLKLDPRSAGPVPREARIQALPGRAG